MNCPECKNGDTKVIDSRCRKNGEYITRRRRCPDCNHSFTTYEFPLEVPPGYTAMPSNLMAFIRKMVAFNVYQIEAFKDMVKVFCRANEIEKEESNETT